MDLYEMCTRLGFEVETHFQKDDEGALLWWATAKMETPYCANQETALSILEDTLDQMVRDIIRVNKKDDQA